MKTDYHTITDIDDLLMHLLSISLFYGDYAIPFHLNNPSSTISLSIKKKDVAALRKFAARNWLDFDLLEHEKRDELEKIYQKIIEKYSAQIKSDEFNLPREFLLDLGERAMTMGKFRDAHAAFKAAQQLDQRVNQYLDKAYRILQSKEISSGDVNNELLLEKFDESAQLIFLAVRLKNPFGNQFQKTGYDLHYLDSESQRKYNKYIEQNLFKEIIDFGIHFLLDDKTIADKVANHLGSGKTRRQMLKSLAILFSGGEEKYNKFVANYRKAAEIAKNAKSDQDLMQAQKTLLGRGTGDNVHYQFLRELCLEHPLGALLVSRVQSPEGTLYIIPRILKSGESLLDFLDLG